MGGGRPEGSPAGPRERWPDFCPGGIRHEGGVALNQALAWNVGTCRPDAKGEIHARFVVTRDCGWVVLYIERWLKAPVQMPAERRRPRERDTARGYHRVPLLANLVLHYAFDVWMRRNQPDIPFERYADDAICHCDSEEQATALRRSLESRFAECGLTLHPEKTKIVYCKDEDRRQDYPSHRFKFLGYTFRPRLSRRRGDRIGVTFSPAVSGQALKAIRQTVQSWTLHERSDKSLDDLARMFNASIRHGISYDYISRQMPKYAPGATPRFYRFHLPHAHLASPFGDLQVKVADRMQFITAMTFLAVVLDSRSSFPPVPVLS